MADYELVSKDIVDGWNTSKFSDGTEQWYLGEKGNGGHELILVERVNRPRPKRKGWFVVTRDAKEFEPMYPPALAGPFETLEAAKAACLLLM